MISLKPYNTYHIDAYARNVYFPNSIKDCIEIYQKHRSIVVLGNGSNVILARANYKETAFIIVGNNFANISIVSKGIYAQAGVLLKTLSLYTYQHCLSGLETFFDVPASVGGAMIMNTGAYGDQVYDCVAYVDILDLNTFKEQRIDKENIDHGYRYSMFKFKPCFVLGACFDLIPKAQTSIKTKMDNILAQRQAKLPHNPSAGSVFKRPEYDITVGEMVEKIGLKGYQIGGAQISKKHGGIIINAGKATGEDVLALVSLIQEKVSEAFDVQLFLEQIVID